MGAGAYAVADDINSDPGKALDELRRQGSVLVLESYGPFEAPSPHNPCMRTAKRGRYCLAWGFAIFAYPEEGSGSGKGGGAGKHSGRGAHGGGGAKASGDKGGGARAGGHAASHAVARRQRHEGGAANRTAAAADVGYNEQAA